MNSPEITQRNRGSRMHPSGIGTIQMEETAELVVKAFQTMDFTEADKAIARNSMKELVALQAVKNKVYDVVCWSNENGTVVHSVTRSPRPGHDLQSSVLIRGEAFSHQNIDIGKNVHEIEFPNGRPMFSVEQMNLETERVLAVEYGVALSPNAWEKREELYDQRPEGLDEIMEAKTKESELPVEEELGKTEPEKDER